jgi:hypothetical protein
MTDAINYCIDIKGVGGVLGLRSGVYIKPEGSGFDFIRLHEKGSYTRNDKPIDDDEGIVLRLHPIWLNMKRHTILMLVEM